MNHCDQAPTVWQLVQPWVTWALVVLGWGVLHVTAVQRARRQEEALLITQVETRIAEIRDLAIRYYTSDPKDPSTDGRTQEAQLKHKLQSLASSLQRFRIRKPKNYNLDSELMDLRRAVTSDPFESRSRTRLSHNDQVVQRLWFSSDNFIVALQAELERANKTTFGSPWA